MRSKVERVVVNDFPYLFESFPGWLPFLNDAARPLLRPPREFYSRRIKKSKRVNAPRTAKEHRFQTSAVANFAFMIGNGENSLALQVEAYAGRLECRLVMKKS